MARPTIPRTGRQLNHNSVACSDSLTMTNGWMNVCMFLYNLWTIIGTVSVHSYRKVEYMYWLFCTTSLFVSRSTLNCLRNQSPDLWQAHFALLYLMIEPNVVLVVVVVVMDDVPLRHPQDVTVMQETEWWPVIVYSKWSRVYIWKGISALFICFMECQIRRGS